MNMYHHDRLSKNIKTSSKGRSDSFSCIHTGCGERNYFMFICLCRSLSSHTTMFYNYPLLAPPTISRLSLRVTCIFGHKLPYLHNCMCISNSSWGMHSLNTLVFAVTISNFVIGASSQGMLSCPVLSRGSTRHPLRHG